MGMLLSVNNWEQTYWEDEQGNTTTIQEVLEELQDEPIVSLEVAALTHLRRSTIEPDRKQKADLSFPIIVRKKDNKFEMEVYEPIKIFNSEETEKKKLDITLQLNKILEQMIAKDPGQWIWTHNRWK